MTNKLVKAQEGKGYNLMTQEVYVSGRPYVVENSSEVQMGSARNALIILGDTTMTDEAFAELYVKDPAGAIEKALEKDKDADPEVAKKAAEKAEAAAKKAKADEAAEEERVKAEQAERKAAEAEAKKGKGK